MTKLPPLIPQQRFKNRFFSQQTGKKVVFFFLTTLLILPEEAFAMHIMEGFLPVEWASFWTLVVIPFLIYGYRSIKQITDETPKLKLLLALAGAFVFALSALKLPSLAGSSSHPTGIALGAILFGPGPMAIIGTIALLFQALLLGHGGLTTLGANVFSMAVAGPFIAFAIYFVTRKAGFSTLLAVFLAAALADLSTYIVTAFQLAMAFPAESGGILFSFTKFLSVFAITQIPLAIMDGLITATVFHYLKSYRGDDIAHLKLHSKEV